MDPQTRQIDQARVILVHDWLTGMRGGEKCLEVAAQHWPDARLFTLLHRRGSVSEAIERLRIRTSCLNLLPGVHRYYRYLLPLMPQAVSGWRPPPADLVLSFSHCVAKGVRPALSASGGPAPHICYCFTPMRYAWHLRGSYFGGRVRGLPARILDRLLDQLRDWDRQTAAGVSHFVAISQTIRQRIRECYDRDSEIIYPPVDTEFYHPQAQRREDFYLVVSALAPYKRIDLAVSACARLGKKLVIIGTGQDEPRIRRLAGPDVRMLGWQSNETIRDHLRRCRALLFPGEEDFGIVPVEAMACGAPVIALGKGGLTETVIPPGQGQEPTGLWFPEQTSDSLAEALLDFEAHLGDFDPKAARSQALRFDVHHFRSRLLDLVGRVLTPPQRASRHAA